MAAVMIRRAACRTLALGARAESTMAAVAVNAVDSTTDADAVLQQIGPVADEVQLARLTAAVALPASSEQAAREVGRQRYCARLALQCRSLALSSKLCSDRPPAHRRPDPPP